MFIRIRRESFGIRIICRILKSSERERVWKEKSETKRHEQKKRETKKLSH